MISSAPSVWGQWKHGRARTYFMDLDHGPAYHSNGLEVCARCRHITYVPIAP